MVGRVKAWFLRAAGTLVLLVSTGLILVFAAGGFSRSGDGPAAVSVSDTLRHLLASDPERPLPVAEGTPFGVWPIVPPPTAAELQANLEKSLARGRLRRYDQGLASVARK